MKINSLMKLLGAFKCLQFIYGQWDFNMKPPRIKIKNIIIGIQGISEIHINFPKNGYRTIFLRYLCGCLEDQACPIFLKIYFLT